MKNRAEEPINELVGAVHKAKARSQRLLEDQTAITKWQGTRARAAKEQRDMMRA